jgi:hypothetical protein
MKGSAVTAEWKSSQIGLDVEPDGTCPSGKQRYGSRADARYAAQRSRRRRKHLGTFDDSRLYAIYQCRRCAGWHQTSDPHLTDTVEYV